MQCSPPRAMHQKSMQPYITISKLGTEVVLDGRVQAAGHSIAKLVMLQFNQSRQSQGDVMVILNFGFPAAQFGQI
jgi:hypothetical protein